MSIKFKFAIGDRVACMLAIEELKYFLAHCDAPTRPHVLAVEERLSVECVGGVQLFYTCRDMHGRTEKHPESMLAPAGMMLDVWIDGVLRQSERSNRSKK